MKFSTNTWNTSNEAIREWKLDCIEWKIIFPRSIAIVMVSPFFEFNLHKEKWPLVMTASAYKLNTATTECSATDGDLTDECTNPKLF